MKNIRIDNLGKKSFARIILLALVMLVSVNTAFAAKIPDNVKNYIKKDFAKTDFRFDGLIILPDGTMYLPLYPAKIKEIENFSVKQVVPEGANFAKKPDIVVFNTDFALMKVVEDDKGGRTVIKLENPPLEVKTGLLPQDMLVPKGLILPENIKGVIGNLQIATSKDKGLRVVSDTKKGDFVPVVHSAAASNYANAIPQMKNKTLYVATCYSKNIHVVNGEGAEPAYALNQTGLPIQMKEFDGKFLVVTMYDNKSLEIISLADERVIKEVEMNAQPREVIVDNPRKVAYVSAPDDSLIFKVDLSSMTLKQKIKVNGWPQHLYLTPDGEKLMYADKKSNEIYVVELDNDYTIKDIGKFPNVSKIVYSQGKIYFASRTRSKLAVVDYVTQGLLKETDVVVKPVDMIVYKNFLYVLGAQNTEIQVFNTDTDTWTNTIKLNTKGFSTSIYKLPNSNLAIVTDTKAAKYSIIDLDKKTVVKTNDLYIPASEVVVVNRVRKIGK